MAGGTPDREEAHRAIVPGASSVLFLPTSRYGDGSSTGTDIDHRFGLGSAHTVAECVDEQSKEADAQDRLDCS